MKLSKLFKTHLQDFENEESGIQYNYIQRVAKVNQDQVNEEMYSHQKSVKKALKEIRKSEFAETQEAEESSRILLKEFNTISSLLVKSISLSILDHKSKTKGNLGIWENLQSCQKLGVSIIKASCANLETNKFSVSANDPSQIYKSYLHHRIKNFDKNEAESLSASSLLRICETNSCLEEYTDLMFLDPSCLEFGECPSLSTLMSFYCSSPTHSIVQSEIALSKASVLELDIMTRLLCFHLAKEHKCVHMFDFYNDRVTTQIMGEFVVLLDELMHWIENLETEMHEMAGMPVLVSIKNVVLKIVKFGADCPYRLVVFLS
jgi:hypothetical protein